ncbi:tetratricopeptide repeat protein [Xanthomonas sp. NCPPB 2654]|uniref:YfgM family protein n=1 Tax=unclassified Xanthomonas TaxID=2643310 RepID=UPI0021DFFCBB|nr:MULTISPECIES: tetratricopeptide repeat protein [unclassified Xanthomonas]MDL5364839.1 tetratricopeptide repeat protein [Xanthomonas sp. NCPPB 2654]MEB1529348.1 tetratricopeptide repeat protein [Xanthomonas campestris pv. campestris]UYC18863.1 tetratricopeptide repeat protein [Xanthomonas sp. CFBP 8443]
MAIDDLLDEHEQSERVRTWLRKNGAGLIGGIALGIGAIIGWQWWTKQHSSDLAQANARYDAVLKSIQANQLDKAGKDMAALQQGPANIYAELAALRLAKAHADAGKYDQALATLRGLKTEGELKLLVDQRVARLLIQTGKSDEALKLLASADDNQSLEIRGDALIAQGKRDAARDAYAKSLTTLDVAAPQRRLLETKLMDAGGTVPNPAEPI